MARYVQINTVPNLSTGNVMFRTAEERSALGDECWIVWGRGRAAKNEREINFGSASNTYLDALLTRLIGRPGFHSRGATKKLLAQLDKIDPDIVHLHNLHGYYLNVELLFEWLSKHRCEVKWTLHDCWAFTGHCSHFTFVKCDQWKNGCDQDYPCPQIHEYPRTFSRSSCEWSYRRKKELFRLISKDRLTLITPSSWLANLVGESFLGGYQVQVKNNSIDLSIFKPTHSVFRKCRGLENAKIILGVANPWSPRKGLLDFLRLKEDLGSDVQIVLVGLSREQQSNLPEGILGLGRTDSPQELAGLYSTADLFFNPTYEDNYPTVNLEAEACGTDVISYNTGGCSETLGRNGSLVVSDYEEALIRIRAYLNIND